MATDVAREILRVAREDTERATDNQTMAVTVHTTYRPPCLPMDRPDLDLTLIVYRNCRDVPATFTVKEVYVVQDEWEPARSVPKAGLVISFVTKAVAFRFVELLLLSRSRYCSSSGVAALRLVCDVAVEDALPMRAGHVLELHARYKKDNRGAEVDPSLDDSDGAVSPCLHTLFDLIGQCTAVATDTTFDLRQGMIRR